MFTSAGNDGVSAVIDQRQIKCVQRGDTAAATHEMATYPRQAMRVIWINSPRPMERGPGPGSWADKWKFSPRFTWTNQLNYYLMQVPPPPWDLVEMGPPVPLREKAPTGNRISGCHCKPLIQISRQKSAKTKKAAVNDSLFLLESHSLSGRFIPPL